MRYCKIDPTSINDGKGVRTVLYVSGCTMNCLGCHNPQTHSFDYGREFNNQAKEYLFKYLSKPYIDGLTLTGGHPLESRINKEVLSLIDEVKLKFPNKTIWLYTGYTIDEIINQEDMTNKFIISQCDYVVDGKFDITKRDITLAFRGSSNQKIYSVKEGKYVDF